MAMIKTVGYGQVEPNHLSAQRTGQIYAQTPVNSAIKELENGSFLKMNSIAGTLGKEGSGEWMLVFNEVKLYENHKQGYKDFRVEAVNNVGGTIVPRVFKTNIGDRFTTNMVDTVAAIPGLGTVLGIEAGSGAYSEVGILKEGAPAAGEMAFEIIKVYTMPDGSPAVKVVRVA